MEKDLKEYITPPILLILFLLVLSLLVVMPVLNMILLGAILSFCIRPINRRLQTKIKYSSISISLSIILVVIPLILLLIYMAMVIGGFVSENIISNPALSQESLNATFSELSSAIPPQYLSSVSSSLNTALNEIGNFIVNSVVSLVSEIPSLSLEIFILVCSVFYFTRDGDKLFNFIKDFVPDNTITFFDNTVKSVKNVLKSIFYGHFLTSLIIGIVAAIGYSLLGYPYGIFLGILTGIFQLIPVFGPWPIYWALAIIDFIHGDYMGVVLVLLFGFGLSLSDMYIRPALSSHYAEIHPLILLIGFLTGPLVYGLTGFILCPLLLGITYAVLDSYRKELKNKKETS